MKKLSPSASLGTFIEEHHDEIIAEWVAFARTLVPWAKTVSEKALRDHAEELLTAVVTDMGVPQSGEEQAAKSQGQTVGGALARVGQKHASQRMATGFNLDQLVSEYRALRASILRLWAEAHGDTKSEVTRFNEAIDESLTEATVRYSSMLDHTREQFLAILGHDLRNPLSSIILGAQVLMRSESLDDKAARIATRIHSSGGRMNRLVSDLLDLTRTRLGSGIPVTRRFMDLAPVCEQVIAELDAIHSNSRLRFVSKGDVRGEWDSDRLAQVISNLVANALQYGGDDGAVRVFAEEHGDEVVLRVHNEGPPIPQKMLRKIFEPMFRQPSEDNSTNTSGLGLGLYIAREVVTAHCGTIAVTSTDAAGTTFTVKIPRHPPGGKTSAETDA